MVTSDPIADMLTRIRNANLVGHEKVEIPGSNIKRHIAEILKHEGFVRDAEFITDEKQGVIRLFLKYGKRARTRYHRSETDQQAWLACVRESRQHSTCTWWTWCGSHFDI
jgi:ribosomal protein S8